VLLDPIHLKISNQCVALLRAGEFVSAASPHQVVVGRKVPATNAASLLDRPVATGVVDAPLKSATPANIGSSPSSAFVRVGAARDDPPVDPSSSSTSTANNAAAVAAARRVRVDSMTAAAVAACAATGASPNPANAADFIEAATAAHAGDAEGAAASVVAAAAAQVSISFLFYCVEDIVGHTYKFIHSKSKEGNAILPPLSWGYSKILLSRSIIVALMKTTVKEV